MLFRSYSNTAVNGDCNPALPVAGYPHPHRFSLKGFHILQNIQMGRLCDVRGRNTHTHRHTRCRNTHCTVSRYSSLICGALVRWSRLLCCADEKVQVIYVSPVNLGEDLALYYTRLLSLQGGREGGREGGKEGPAQAPCVQRFTIITPDALEYFPVRTTSSMQVPQMFLISRLFIRLIVFFLRINYFKYYSCLTGWSQAPVDFCAHLKFIYSPQGGAGGGFF